MRITGRQLRQIIKEEVESMIKSSANPRNRRINEGVSSAADLGRMASRLITLTQDADPQGESTVVEFSVKSQEPMRSDFVPVTNLTGKVILTKSTGSGQTIIANSLSMYVGQAVDAQLVLSWQGKPIAANVVDYDGYEDILAVLGSEFQDAEAGLVAMLGNKPRVDIPVTFTGNTRIML